MQFDYLIVGAGLYGCVFAREMTDAGKKCLVIDRRPHIAGNAHCEEIEGICVHRYGPHIFHTADEEVWQYVNRFASFNSFVNTPMAVNGEEMFHLPFNMNTFSKLWGVKTPREARVKIAEQTAPYQALEPRNLEEQALKLAGNDIYETLIRDFTVKQWGRPCRELPAFIIRRLPLRYTWNNNYFDPPHQGVPLEGYDALARRLLEGSEVRLGVTYRELIAREPDVAAFTVYTGSIDEYFDYCFGRLQYRSVRFEDEVIEPCPDGQPANWQGVAVVNYTGPEVPFTRIIEHKHFLYGQQEKTVISREYPCEQQEGMEPSYPVNDERNQALYQRYADLAAGRSNLLFGGRLGSYRYLDMDQTIRAALDAARAELCRR